MFTLKRRSLLAVLGAGLAVTLVVAGCSSDKDSSSETTLASGEAGTGDSAAAIDNPCPGAATANHKYDKEPVSAIDVNKSYTATMVTTKGTIEFALDAKKAPITVNSFVFLANEKYFDCIGFHRVVPGFVLQGGDPNTLIDDPANPPERVAQATSSSMNCPRPVSTSSDRWPWPMPDPTRTAPSSSSSPDRRANSFPRRIRCSAKRPRVKT